MKLSQYITMLQHTLITEGDYDVAITQDGYYAEGYFADMYFPPRVENIDVGHKISYHDGLLIEGPEEIMKFIIIGNSSQNP